MKESGQDLFLHGQDDTLGVTTKSEESKPANEHRDKRDLHKFDLLEDYDNQFRRIAQSFFELRQAAEIKPGESHADYGDRIAGQLKLIADEITALVKDTPSLASELPQEINEDYFDHDASFFRNNTVGGTEELLKDVDDLLKDIVKTKKRRADIVPGYVQGELEKILEFWRRLRKIWESYRLIMDDLFLRCGPQGEEAVDSEHADIDKRKSISRVLDSMEDFVKNKERIKPIEIVYLTPRKKIENLRVGVPHGMMFGFLHSCVDNALRDQGSGDDIGASQIKYTVGLVDNYEDGLTGQQLVFTVEDDGRGIPPELLDPENEKYIFKKFATTRPENTGSKVPKKRGIGMANYDKRFAQVGAEK